MNPNEESSSDESEDGDHEIEKHKCVYCSKVYSKVSNLKNHVDIAHRGRRFICSICKKENTTKYSLARHMSLKHPETEVMNIQENEVYVADKIELTESAKDALILRLKSEIMEKDKIIEQQENIIEKMKSELLSLKISGNLQAEDKSKQCELQIEANNQADVLLPLKRTNFPMSLKAWNYWAKKK